MSPEPQTFIRPDRFWRDLGLRAGQTVVHLGCGSGYYLIPAAEIVGHKGNVVGIDVQAPVLEEAQSKAARAGVADVIRTVRADLENKSGSSLEAGAADWTLVANILYQANPKKILAEAARITKKGGLIVVVEWEPGATPLGPPSEARLTKANVLELVEQMQLSVRNEFKPSPYHYGLVLEA